MGAFEGNYLQRDVVLILAEVVQESVFCRKSR